MATSGKSAPSPAGDKLLTPTEVAALLRVSPVTVRHWALEGKLPFETTPGGHRRFTRAAVESFAREQGVRLYGEAPHGLRVLIVDDNEDLAHYLEELIAGLTGDIQVARARDGFEAGDQLHRFRPDVVLLDLKMPGMDGFEACRRIKHNATTRHVRVIAMTGYPSVENLQKILLAGAEVCLPKPVRVPDLINALGIGETATSAG